MRVKALDAGYERQQLGYMNRKRESRLRAENN
ncbi:hypothetical protein [Acinetobacter phage Ab69]|nr:hypothetical protein [Acinetobacter phage Ab69]